MFLQAPPTHHPLPIIIRVRLDPEDLADAALLDMEAEPETRALVSVTCTLLHGSDHPEFLTEARLARLPSLLDAVLTQAEPDASRDLEAIWDFVDECFEAGTPVHTLLLEAVARRSSSRLTAIVKGSVRRKRRRR
jgi:hypothetical protein